MILKTLSSVATGLGRLVEGIFFAPLMLIAVGVGVVLLLADRLSKKRFAELFCACGTQPQGVPQSPVNWEVKDNK